MASAAMAKDKAEIANGDARCVFTRQNGAWQPDWFYLAGKRMLRFKDHEWMSIGHLQPAMKKASRAGDGLTFEGVFDFYDTPVACTVTVLPAADGPGFVVESAMSPQADIEVLEALTAFECPYEYDGSEESTTVIGQEPVFQHKDGKANAGLLWKHPFWYYNRHLAARMSAPCYAPMLCHHVSNANGTNPRWITLLGHWNDCTFRDIYSTPTNKMVPKHEREVDPLREFVDPSKGLRGYKYIVGALNWSSSMLKDPCMLFRKGQTVRQRVTVDFTSDLAGRTFDQWLLDAWQRLAGFSFPSDGRVKAWDVAGKLGIDWQRANKELVSLFRKKEVKGLWSEKEGIVVYVDGTRPKAGGHSKGFTLQWLAPLGYQAKLFGDERLKKRVYELAEMGAEDLEKSDPRRNSTLGPIFFYGIPSVRTLQHADPRPPRLENATRQYLAACVDAFNTEGEGMPLGDYGMRANAAETLLLGGRTFGDNAMIDKGLGLVDDLNAQLDDKFWYFGCGVGDWCPAGKQVRPIGYGHAILANLIASEIRNDTRHVAAARRFANYLVSICYSTWNASPSPDLDTRGWACGANSGRDQWAEFPPMETCDAIRCVAALLGKIETVPAFYDVLFLIARTGLAMLPAARTHVRIYDTNGTVNYVATAKFHNERAIYARFPFISYENPWDQTLQAPYQSVEPLQNYLTFGGGIAEVADDRVLAIVPDAASFVYDGSGPCEAHVWNPTAKPVKTAITFHGKPAAAPLRIVAANGSATEANGSKAIAITVPPRAVLKVFC